MAKKDSADDFVGMIIAIVLFLPIVAIVYLFKGVSILIKYIVEQKARKDEENAYKNLLNTNIQEQLIKVDNLEGLQFERYVSELLKKIGFKNVIVTKGSGDFGADIIAQKDGNKYAFQCKRFASPIGPKPIGEVLRGMNKYQCNKGIVITNNYFTKQAIQEAEVSNVELWDRDKLASLIGNEPSNQEKILIIDKDENTNKVIELEEREARIIPMEERQNLDVNSNDGNNKEVMKDMELVAGYYEVGEDIEEGKYIIEAISGTGTFSVYDKEDNYKESHWMGIGNKDYIKKFNNLKLSNGDTLKVNNTVVLKFTKVEKKEKNCNSCQS